MEKLRISNMQKINSELNKNYMEALSNPEFSSLVKRLKISDNVARMNVTKLNDTLNELKLCKECKGLYQCKNSVNGFVYFPEKYEDKLLFSYTPCKYQKSFVKEAKEKESGRNVLDKARMKDIDITDKNRVKVIKWIKQFYDNYNINKVSKGLFLHGTFGSGKTFLIASLFNELKETKNVDTEIVYFPDFLRNLKDNFNLVESKVSYLQSVELLLIDDIGAENVTAWGRDDILGTILQTRMNEGLTTFFTSNLNIEELESHLALTKNNEDFVKARRISERVKQLTEDIELISANKRK